MTGTLVNTGAILFGGIAGVLIGKRLNKRVSGTVMQGVALAVALIGLSGGVEQVINGASVPVIIISLALGGLIGAVLDIDGRFTKLAAFAERKLVKDKGGFAESFVTGSILYCVGTMAIVGSIESGVLGDHSILYAKSMLDGISAVVLGASLGSGVMLSALPVFIYQGAITLAAGFVSGFITDVMLIHISAVGGTLVFAIGLNMLEVTKIKLANFLPAVFVPVIYYLIVRQGL